MVLQRWRAAAWLLFGGLLLAGCSKGPQPGAVLDEAKQVGRDGASFKHSADDYFHDMDGAVKLDPAEIAGRNMWIVWSGGNDRFWDRMSGYTFGAFDLLKVVSSHPSLGYNRESRWQYFGLINEPCFESATGADPNRRGLWLDVRSKGCAPDPFETRASILASPSGRAASPSATARRCRSARSTATRAASSACACFRTRHSTRRRPRPGIPSATTPTRATTTTRTWSARTASACRAASATSGRAR
jgi:hypothetical protein